MVDDILMGGESGENKLEVLIYDLLVAEAWKEKIYPLLRSTLVKNSIKGYVSIYHQAIVSNLLEILMFHRSACEEADDALVELIDFCY